DQRRSSTKIADQFLHRGSRQLCARESRQAWRLVTAGYGKFGIGSGSTYAVSRLPRSASLQQRKVSEHIANNQSTVVRWATRRHFRSSPYRVARRGHPPSGGSMPIADLTTHWSNSRARPGSWEGYNGPGSIAKFSARPFNAAAEEGL